VPVSTEAVGKTYAPVVYAAGREKVREYAAAVGETNPLHLDPGAARAAGYADVVAPPMFAVVYSAPALGPAVLDPVVGINLMMMVHGGQEFVWGPPVVGGDEVTTTVSVKDISERGGMGFYVFESASENVRGERVCTGIARAQTEAGGGPESLKRLSVQFRGVGLPEHEIVVSGRVVRVDGDRAVVETAAEQDGKKIVRKPRPSCRRPTGRGLEAAARLPLRAATGSPMAD
jgi:acyl dehydratase